MEIFIEPTVEKGGPMHISDLQWNTDLANVILEGLKELNQDIGNINNDLKNGNYYITQKRIL